MNMTEIKVRYTLQGCLLSISRLIMICEQEHIVRCLLLTSKLAADFLVESYQYVRGIAVNRIRSFIKQIIDDQRRPKALAM